MERFSVLLREDVKRHVKPVNPFVDFLRAMLNPQFQAVFYFRVSTWFYQKCGLKLIGRFFHALALVIYKVDIHPGAEIGKGLSVGHMTIVISEFAKIGENFTLTHCNTIGGKDPLVLTAPKIGNNVFVSAGARIVGDITVGNNVVVGANAVVMNDIPDNHIAVGIPAIAKPGSNAYLKHYAEDKQ